MYKRITQDNYFIESWWGEWSIECNNNTYKEAIKTLKEYIYNNPSVMYRIRYQRTKI